jgi:hypothetical protein
LPAEIFSFESELVIAQTGLRLTIVGGKKQKKIFQKKPPERTTQLPAGKVQSGED